MVTNGCPCGYYQDIKKECKCHTGEIQKYLKKISGPLLDRIDIHIEVPSMKFQSISSEPEGESSAAVKERVNAARKIQKERFDGTGVYCNCHMSAKMVKKFCKLTDDVANLLRSAIDKMGLSGRAHDKILRVARTIADLSNSPDIAMDHVTEAIQYRSLDRYF